MNDLGTMGGSGVAFTPTIMVTPESHLRLDMTRVNFLRPGSGGMNSIAITAGLSPNMEFSTKVQSIQTGTLLSPAFVGFGGKLVLPFYLPFGSRSALWAEIISTTSSSAGSLLPPSVNRFAMIVQPAILRKTNAYLLLGITASEGAQRLLAGCNVSRVVSSLIKVGGEVQYNYFGRGDLLGSSLILFRLNSNMCVQLNPGYVQSSQTTSWMISLGLSVSTAGIELITAEKPKEKEIPSFDDLEKQVRDEKKNDK
jgi:hypothetical protein